MIYTFTIQGKEVFFRSSPSVRELLSSWAGPETTILTKKEFDEIFPKDIEILDTVEKDQTCVVLELEVV